MSPPSADRAGAMPGTGPGSEPDLRRMVVEAPSGTQARIAGKLLSRIVTRRNWALHRHVHLVAAFEAARRDGPVGSVLAVGCGAGLSELFLAVKYPQVSFTLTDRNPVNLGFARRVGDAWGITNVRYELLDLLEPPPPASFDFVSSIEVLEHIDDDLRAAANLRARSRAYVYLLVPHSSPEELRDERRAVQAWEVHGHHRSGYARDRFDVALGDHHRLFLRNTYFMPAGGEVRAHLRELSDDELVDRRVELIAGVASDVQDRLVDGGAAEAQGIEGLIDVRLPRRDVPRRRRGWFGRQPPPGRARPTS